MKTSAVILVLLALVAAAFGFWVLAGVAAWVIRVLALIFLVMAVLSLRKRAVSK
jgi:uncharacterized membrane protein YtjA (UPF0391 family)